jgi:hypothetical protein
MLVGDPDQLPPVGPGQPVADALAEGLLPCIDLRQIYRTAANSRIVTSAHAINRGRYPSTNGVFSLLVAHTSWVSAEDVQTLLVQCWYGRCLSRLEPPSHRLGLTSLESSAWIRASSQVLPSSPNTCT